MHLAAGEHYGMIATTGMINSVLLNFLCKDINVVKGLAAKVLSEGVVSKVSLEPVSEAYRPTLTLCYTCNSSCSIDCSTPFIDPRS